ncbi:cutinase transcription factor 1 beta [Aspergillus udagawae]|nr:cutinase transcription factor 1 beta [Aspergillus udagawae]
MSSKSKTKVACKSCNLRRVKCDRTEDSACFNCRVAGQECQPIISRRGKYKRSNTKSRRSGSARRAAVHSQDGSRGSPGTQHPVAGESTHPDPTLFGTAGEEACGSGQPPSPRFINRTNDPGRGKEMVYYGDSFNLNYVLREMGNPFQGDFDSSSLKVSIEELYLNHLGRPMKDHLDAHEHSERFRLQEMGAFQRLNKDISDALLQTFFAVVYPFCPIFDLSEFHTKYKAEQISPLVLQALYFAAAAHCELSLIEKAGFASRYMATFTFYQRAKALYDANYESDSIATVQALYLLSYWWGSPLEQKDMWHWTGLAVGLAQTLGLHQSKTYAGLPERQQRLWRRIWWTVYSHDILMALTLGNTPHVNEAYSNVPLLSEADIEDDEDGWQDMHLIGSQTQECRLYIVYLVDLAKRTSQCLEALFGASSNESKIQTSLDRVSSWQTTLPHVLQRNNSIISLQSGYWTSLIHLTYNTCQILLHRNGFHYPDRLKMGSLPSDAAVNIVRILEDMMSSEVLTVSCLRTLPAVFASLSVQIANISGNSPDGTGIAKHRARFCMLVLKTLQDRWAPLVWYYSMFLKILHKMGCEIPDGEEHSTYSFHDRSLGASSTTEPLPDATWRQPQHNQIFENPSGSFMAEVLTEEADYGAVMECFPFSSFLADSMSGQSDTTFDQADNAQS